MSSILAASGEQIFLPSWGRSFWQDSVTGDMICLYASGTTEVDYITSSDSGVSWSAPSFAFPVDDFSTHNNFDTSMDRVGNVHCVHRFNTSGCYTILAKTTSGAWAPSGVVARGFFDCRSTVDARDFNGSIEVYDKKMGVFGGGPGTPPTAWITAVEASGRVKAWHVSSPFTAIPALQGIVHDIDVGPSGGFPFPTDAGQFDALATPFSVDSSGIAFFEYSFSNKWKDKGLIQIDPGIDETNLARISGYIGDVNFTPNSAWCKTHFLKPTQQTRGTINTVITTVGSSGKFELYTTANEINSAGFGFFRVDSTDTNHTGLGSSRRLNTENLTFKELPNNIAGATPLLGGGTPVGITYYDDPYTLFLYFQGRRTNGDQTISRIKATVDIPESVTPTSALKYNFSDLSDADSGLVSWADATVMNAGAGSLGLENIVHWQKFKVSHSPVDAGSGLFRSEIIATVGSGVVNGSGDVLSKLYMWRFDDSLAAQGELPLPTYVTNLTAQSGDSFIGIDAFTGITDPGNLFDQDTATSGIVSSGDSITLEFDKIYTFNRLEFAWNSPPAGFIGVDVSASYDNATFVGVHSVPSGIAGASPSLVKSSAEWDRPQDASIDVDMDGFSAKYVKLDFVGDATARDVREVRLYGAHTTAGYIGTSAFSTTFFSSKGSFKTETFTNVPLGGTPNGWTTYGDFNWGVDRGLHSSGAFFGETIGSGSLSLLENASALRTDRNPPINSSGVFEFDVEVVSPRTISFDMKWDSQANVGSIDPNEPTDDYLELFIITPTGTVDKTADIYNGLFITPASYVTRSFTLDEPGVNTVRIIYNRGNIEAGLGPVGGEAAVWFDNFANLDPSEADPNLLTSVYGYIRGAGDTASGVIYAYASGVDFVDRDSLAYMSGGANVPAGVTNAYLLGDTMASGMVYAYIVSNTESTSVAAFMEGSIDTAVNVVGAYIFTSGLAGNIFGYMENTVNESIYGFLKAPSGALSTVNAYISTPEFASIHGYLKGPVPNSGQVYGYLIARGYDDHIYGYIDASGLNTSAYGYINARGITGNIFAYMPNGDKTNVAGYIQGADVASGVINAWMSGVGVESGMIYAYIPGISGTATGIFNGYMSAVELPSSIIYAHVIGFDGSGACNFPVPLPPSVAVPTGNFFT